MKNKKNKTKEKPRLRSYVETLLLTGQAPAFGIEDTALLEASAEEKKTRR